MSNKWLATCTIDNGESTFPVVVNAETKGAAYVKVMCQLPSRCARGDTNDGIISLEPYTSEKSPEISPKIPNNGPKKSVKINILDTSD